MRKTHLRNLLTGSTKGRKTIPVRVAVTLLTLVVAIASALTLFGSQPDSRADGGGGGQSGHMSGGSIFSSLHADYVWFDSGGWESGLDGQRFNAVQGWGDASAWYFWNHYVNPRSMGATGQPPRTDHGSVGFDYKNPDEVYMDAAREALENAKKRDSLATRSRVIGVGWAFMGTNYDFWQFITGAAISFTSVERGHVVMTFKGLLPRPGNSSELPDDAGWGQPASIGNSGYNPNNPIWRDYIWDLSASDCPGYYAVVVAAVNDHELPPPVGHLEIDKTVTGLGNDPDKKFNFHVKVWDANGKTHLDQDFQLSANDPPRRFENLPANANYEITEVTDNDYVTTWSNRTGTIIGNDTVTITANNKRKTGYGKVRKVSTDRGSTPNGDTTWNNTEVKTAGNSNYNMSGIQYTIYKTQADANAGTNPVQTLTLNSNGDSPYSQELPTGTYYIKETRNNMTGYYSDPSPHAVQIIYNDAEDKPGETTWDVSNNPMIGFITVVKNSASTAEAVELSGFKFQIKGIDSANSYIDKEIVTDGNGVARLAYPLPLGNYSIEETYAVAPYYKDLAKFNVALKQADNNGNLKDCIADQSLSKSALRNVYKVATGDTRTRNRQWGHLEAIKKNTATGGTVTEKNFKWLLFKQNRNWTAARNNDTLVGVAYTNQGETLSGVGGDANKGKAIFMKPTAKNLNQEAINWLANPSGPAPASASGITPVSGQPADLPAKNTRVLDEGYYEIVEVSADDPFWINEGVYRVVLKAANNQGKTQADITAGPKAVIFKNGNPVSSVSNEQGITIAQNNNVTQKNFPITVPVELPDAPWSYVKVIKKNTATEKTIQTGNYRFELYKQNKARNLPRTKENLLGVAVTNKGATNSCTTVNGEAVFMVPDAQGNPTANPVKLPVVNKVNANEGYYDVYETNVVEPFWLTPNRYQVTVYARDDNGRTKSLIDAKPGEDATTIFTLAGHPIAKIDVDNTDGWGVKVPSSPIPTLKNNENTTQIAIANDQYAFIEIIKKNMELTQNGQDVTQAGFKFKLYDTLEDAQNETNHLEEITTDGTGKAAFTTKLPVQRTARNDPGQQNPHNSQRIHITPGAGVSGTNRNDGIYYVRESYAVKPYNKSNAIYKFTITADDANDYAAGTEGKAKYSVEVANFGSPKGNVHNNPYTTSFQPYANGKYTNGNNIVLHDSTVAGFSGANVLNVCPTTIQDAPQYGRIKITKSDSEDGSRQQGAEYQIYPASNVDYTGAGGQYVGSQNGNSSQRTPTAGTDNTAGMGKEPVGFTKLSPRGRTTTGDAAHEMGANIGTYDVNTQPTITAANTTIGSGDPNIQHVWNTDVAKVVHNLPAGSSTFDVTTGAVKVNNPVVFYRADGTCYDTIVTDANGEATTGWLPLSGNDETSVTSYYLVEVKTSNGHVIDGTPIKVDLVYDATLQDRECIVQPKETTNNPKTTQKDKPNRISFTKTIESSELNPEGGALPGVTIGFWKSEDDIQVTCNPNDGTYDFDSIVIRTPSLSVVPKVHQRLTGTETYVKELPSGYILQLIDPDLKQTTYSDEVPADPSIAFAGDQVNYTATIPSKTYEVRIIDAATGNPIQHGGMQEITLKEGDRTGITVASGQLTGVIMVSSESKPVEIRDSNLTYMKDYDAWIATNLKAGAVYEVEFDREVVKVINTYPNGGHTWYGRYSKEDLKWFNKGWLDQAALPRKDTAIITSALMKVEHANEKFTTNTTPLTTGNNTGPCLWTTDNHSWLQDTSTQHEYPFATVTNDQGIIVNYRIGAGEYVAAEIKPPVNYQQHTTYLPDTYAHHFTVDDITGYIKDIDDQKPEYRTRRHDDASHVVTQEKDFDFEDLVTKLRLSKYEMSGTKELVGAELVLTSAENDDVIARWIEEEEPYYIEGLRPGWYRLTEYATPQNYEKAETIEFNLLPTGEVQHEIMYDMPIHIDVEIDKKQEIANPLGEQHFPNGDSRNRAEAQQNDSGLYAYSLDFRNTSNTWTDEFTVEDPLEPVNKGYARLRSVVTPQTFQDYDGKMNVWYRTNLIAEDFLDEEYLEYMSDYERLSVGAEDLDYDEEPTPRPDFAANATVTDGHENPWLDDKQAMVNDTDGDKRIIDYDGWYLWQKDLPTAVSTKLDVDDLNLPEGEYVTGIRFEYGRVEVGFTSRVDGWNSEYLKYDHDDVDHITGLSDQSFQASDTAADAAIMRMNLLSARFTTDMSFLLEDYVKAARETARRDYDQKIIDIDEYNSRLAEMETGTLPRFTEALVIPAYADDAEDVEKLDAALEAAKSSLQAAFPLANNPGARDLLLLTARQSVADLEPVISHETLENLNQRIKEYEDEINRIPEDWGGYDIDAANTNLLDAFMRALDDLRTTGLSGRTMYAPAVLHMQLTEEYVPGVKLRNFAHVDAYRNGGNGENPEQPSITTRLTNKDDGTKAVGDSGLVTVIDSVEYRNFTPGKEYVMSGALHIRANGVDGGILIDDGQEVTATTTFTPTEPNGSVNLEFTFHAELLDGADAVAFEDCRMTEDASFKVEHKDINDEAQTVNETGVIPEITTTLKNKADNTHAVGNTGTVTVVDEVRYTGFIPGREYVMSGVLHKRANGIDGGILMDGEREVTATTTFTPTEPDGTVSLEFTFRAELLEGDSAVAFETCRTVADSSFMLTHADINDAAQTVNENGNVLPPEGTESDRDLEGHDGDRVIQTPRDKNDYYIETTLETEDGQKVLDADPSKPAKMVDHVVYHNLIPGKTYQMSCVLHVRSFDDKLKMPIDGGTIKGTDGSTTFTPDQPDGVVDVEVEIPATEFLFRPAVAFEELREVDLFGVASDIVIAEHKDITNEDQTVMVTRPAEEVIGQAPILQTGDDLMPLAIAAGASVAVAGGAYLVRRRRQERQ